jgi:hypothetical protein
MCSDPEGGKTSIENKMRQEPENWLSGYAQTGMTAKSD